MSEQTPAPSISSSDFESAIATMLDMLCAVRGHAFERYGSARAAGVDDAIAHLRLLFRQPPSEWAAALPPVADREPPGAWATPGREDDTRYASRRLAAVVERWRTAHVTVARADLLELLLDRHEAVAALTDTHTAVVEDVMGVTFSLADRIRSAFRQPATSSENHLPTRAFQGLNDFLMVWEDDADFSEWLAREHSGLLARLRVAVA